MPDESRESSDSPASEPSATPTSAPPKSRRSTRKSAPAPSEGAAAGESAPAPAATKKAKEEAPPAPRRAALPEELAVLLRARGQLDRRRPVFGRQQANRYARIGRDGTWRRPRGLQSKQRRHYGYRAKIVRIGYRSPRRVRGLVPSGFRPVVVRSSGELRALDARRDAAIIARTIGTRRRIGLEEEARKRGVRVLNPIVKGEET